MPQVGSIEVEVGETFSKENYVERDFKHSVEKILVFISKSDCVMGRF